MAQFRKDELKSGETYHIYSRSIAKFVIFNNKVEYSRMLQLFRLYRYADFGYRYSQFLDLTDFCQNEIIKNLENDGNLMVQIISYCLMPTHIHLILKQNSDDSISHFMALVLNSYSRYFNTTHKRSGPLWSSRFKNALVSDDNQLLHLTRYLHLNPTSAAFVSKPEDWQYSSYGEFIDVNRTGFSICDYETLLTIKPTQYKKFVNNNKNYQRQLSKIKYLTIDNYSG